MSRWDLMLLVVVAILLLVPVASFHLHLWSDLLATKAAPDARTLLRDKLTGRSVWVGNKQLELFPSIAVPFAARLISRDGDPGTVIKGLAALRCASPITGEVAELLETAFEHPDPMVRVTTASTLAEISTRLSAEERLLWSRRFFKHFASSAELLEADILPSYKTGFLLDAKALLSPADFVRLAFHLLKSAHAETAPLILDALDQLNMESLPIRDASWTRFLDEEVPQLLRTLDQSEDFQDTTLRNRLLAVLLQLGAVRTFEEALSVGEPRSVPVELGDALLFALQERRVGAEATRSIISKLVRSILALPVDEKALLGWKATLPRLLREAEVSTLQLSSQQLAQLEKLLATPELCPLSVTVLGLSGREGIKRLMQTWLKLRLAGDELCSEATESLTGGTFPFRNFADLFPVAIETLKGTTGEQRRLLLSALKRNWTDIYPEKQQALRQQLGQIPEAELSRLFDNLFALLAALPPDQQQDLAAILEALPFPHLPPPALKNCQYLLETGNSYVKAACMNLLLSAGHPDPVLSYLNSALTQAIAGPALAEFPVTADRLVVLNWQERTQEFEQAKAEWIWIEDPPRPNVDVTFWRPFQVSRQGPLRLKLIVPEPYNAYRVYIDNNLVLDTGFQQRESWQRQFELDLKLAPGTHHLIVVVRHLATRRAGLLVLLEDSEGNIVLRTERQLWQARPGIWTPHQPLVEAVSLACRVAGFHPFDAPKLLEPVFRALSAFSQPDFHEQAFPLLVEGIWNVHERFFNRTATLPEPEVQKLQSARTALEELAARYEVNLWQALSPALPGKLELARTFEQYTAFVGLHRPEVARDVAQWIDQSDPEPQLLACRILANTTALLPEALLARLRKLADAGKDDNIKNSALDATVIQLALRLVHNRVESFESYPPAWRPAAIEKLSWLAKRWRLLPSEAGYEFLFQQWSANYLKGIKRFSGLRRLLSLARQALEAENSELAYAGAIFDYLAEYSPPDWLGQKIGQFLVDHVKDFSWDLAGGDLIDQVARRGQQAMQALKPYLLELPEKGHVPSPWVDLSRLRGMSPSRPSLEVAAQVLAGLGPETLPALIEFLDLRPQLTAYLIYKYWNGLPEPAPMKFTPYSEPGLLVATPAHLSLLMEKLRNLPRDRYHTFWLLTYLLRQLGPQAKEGLPVLEPYLQSDDWIVAELAYQTIRALGGSAELYPAAQRRLAESLSMVTRGR